MKALEQLRAERERQGLTQLDVATRIGISLSVFQRLEYGNRDVRVSSLVRYAKALGKGLEIVLVDAEEGETDADE
jgi:transcriptional regulator with XRE-family HTH domain